MDRASNPYCRRLRSTNGPRRLSTTIAANFEPSKQARCMAVSVMPMTGMLTAQDGPTRLTRTTVVAVCCPSACPNLAPALAERERTMLLAHQRDAAAGSSS
jgi:hypothetical protein